MSRSLKYKESQIVKLVTDTVKALTGNGMFLRKITVADVCRYGQEQYPGMKRQNIEEIAKRELKAYEEEVNDIYGFSLKDFNGSIDFFKTFNYMEFYRKNKNNMEPALQELGKNVNRILRYAYKTAMKLKEASVKLDCNDDNRIKKYQDAIKEFEEYINDLEKENKELKCSLRNYMKFFDNLSKQLGKEVVMRERLAKASMPYDPEMDFLEEITKEKEKLEKENILFFERMKGGRENRNA